jgi:FixJ family two-component response regulator
MNPMNTNVPCLPSGNEAIVRIVDDDVAMCRSIAYLAESVGWRVAEYHSAEIFLDTADLGTPGCIVLDVRMPTMSGLELQQTLLARACALPLIFITAHGDISMAVHAMQHKAFDFLEKPFRDQVILDAIARAVRQSLAMTRKRAVQEHGHHRLDLLTDREREVSLLVASGLSSKLIARRLGISDKTVQVHRNHLMEKLGVHSATDIARLVMEIAPELLREQ